MEPPRISLYEANDDCLGNDLKEMEDDMKYLSTKPPDEELRDFNLYDEEGTSESSPSKYTYSKDPSDESRGKLKSSHGKLHLIQAQLLLLLLLLLQNR